MKANELRIGNLIYYRKEDYKVVLIAEDLIKIDTGYGAVQRFEKNPIFSPTIDKLKPIPLTEEWLLKFGFEVNKKTGEAIIYEVTHTTLKWYDGKLFWLAPLGSMRSYLPLDNSLFHIEYVHQLQNLYFVLTGEELEIKK